MKRCFKEEWDRNPQQQCETLIKSYGKQSLQIIAANGGSFENVPLHRTLCRHIFDTGTQHQGVLQKGVS